MRPLELVSAYVYIKDLDHRYVDANRMTRELFDSTSEELIGGRVPCFLPPASAALIELVDNQVLTGKSTREKLVVDCGGGEKRILREMKAPLCADSCRGSIVGLCGISSNITDRKWLGWRLEDQAHTDFLTGLPNRGHFFDLRNAN